MQTTAQLEKLIDFLLPFLEKVESSGNAKAVGDSGRARGILQIHSVYVEDVNRIYKSTFTWDDCFDPDLSRQIAKLYLIHYAERYIEKEKKDVSLAVLARIHNGGLNGYKNPRTISYWDTVKKLITDVA